MSPLNRVVEHQRISRNQDTRRAANARERVWERVPSRQRLTASELADAVYRPHCKIHRDFSQELARAERWLSSRGSRTLRQRTR
jgi:hypothetical protein